MADFESAVKNADNTIINMVEPKIHLEPEFAWRSMKEILQLQQSEPTCVYCLLIPLWYYMFLKYAVEVCGAIIFIINCVFP